MMVQIGIVVPTMGKRIKLLNQCLTSIRNAGPAYILIIAPDEEPIKQMINRELYDELIIDPLQGLPTAIDTGISALPEKIDFVSWLGDDDLLKPDSFPHALEPLMTDPTAVLSFGGCEYIDLEGRTIWINRSGKYAIPLLYFGPQLIPQPGSLIRRTAYISLGGLSTKYKWAFDLDLLIRLHRIGRLCYVDHTLSSFRWHQDSLSVGGRMGSVREASEIRRAALPIFLRIFCSLWETPLRILIFKTGVRMSQRADKLKLYT